MNRILTVILSLLLIGALVACVPTTTPTLQDATATPVAEEEPTAEPEEEPTAEPEEEPTAEPEEEEASEEEETEEESVDEEEMTDEEEADDAEEATEEEASDEEEEEIVFINEDDGGPVSIVGEVAYTNPFFTAGVAQPLVILEDQAGFVDRDENFLMPLSSQTLGQITSNFFESPFSYSVALPIEPQGTYRDVDNDEEEEQGVQIYAVAYWTNTFGDPFLEERDLYGGGWSTAYASTRVSEDFETEREIIGGKLLVYAADDTQSFPINFGEDGLLFTEDDAEMVDLPQGYTVVDLDTVPFTFDRSASQVIDLLEPQGSALIDYSDLTYTEAFTSLLGTLSTEYAFTEYKEIDWEALAEEYQPLFEEADETGDAELYRVALRDFLWEIPDGHISGPFVVEEFQTNVAGGIGMAIRDVDDGRVIVNFVLEGGPAAEAGIGLGTEIISVNETPIDEWVEQSVAYSAPFSTDHVERLQKLRYAVRYPLDTEVEVTFLNPPTDDEPEPEEQTVTLTAISEGASFSFSSFAAGTTGFELPVEYEVLDNGYVLVRITSFFDNQVLTVQLWERLMQTINANGTPGIIIDMRQNGGGFGFLADQMAAYFFDEPYILGNTGYYDESVGEFVFREDDAERFYLPPSEDLRYDGDVVVLVGPACSSACEFFSYVMTIDNRATVVGHYPTGGLGGSVNDLDMPEGERIRYTIGRAVDANGNIHIEGIGVVPDYFVPVTEETLFSEGDPVLDAGVAVLDGEIEVDLGEPDPAPIADEDEEEATEEGAEEALGEETMMAEEGSIAIGQELTATLEAGSTVTFTLTVSEGDIINLYAIASENSFDPYIVLYDLDGTPLTENDDLLPKRISTAAGFDELEIPVDITLIIEVSDATGEAGGDFTLLVEDASE